MLAELIALLVTALVLKQKWKEGWNRGLGALDADPALLEKLERVVLTQSKIRLLLNPAEANHQRLDQAIDAAMKHLQAEASLEDESEADIKTITQLAQSILRQEWQRVKLGV
jgi:hypothetical protein